MTSLKKLKEYCLQKVISPTSAKSSNDPVEFGQKTTSSFKQLA